ncbi:MAG: hypothetical protein QOJ40_2761 [Verrucomicrobiota bacterium]
MSGRRERWVFPINNAYAGLYGWVNRCKSVSSSRPSRLLLQVDGLDPQIAEGDGAVVALEKNWTGRFFLV